MKVIQHDRLYLYKILHKSFSSLNIYPNIIELGVLNGLNSKALQENLQPTLLVLLDAWSSDIFNDYRSTNANRYWVSPIDSFSDYFGGPISDQNTFDKLFTDTQNLFIHDNSVNIIRENTRQGWHTLRKLYPNMKFDLIYIDASHQYETVFDDLMLYQDLVSHTGCIQLNDCCHSNAGVLQNLGVLEATVKFIKMTDFIPVVITNTDWSDVILCRKNNPLICAIDNSILSSDVSYVEVPPQLLGNLRVVNGARTNLSFN